MTKIFTVLFAIIFFSCVSSVHAADIITTEKLITVDTGKQMLYAWEGGKILYQSTISTGLWKSPTVKGDFKIYFKNKLQAHMRGVSPVYGKYDLANVPNVMYFYQSYAIHGAYWHTNFGRRASNGCVNAPLPAADWLFSWAPVGTRVVVF